MVGEGFDLRRLGKVSRLMICGSVGFAALACTADQSSTTKNGTPSEWQYTVLDSSEVSQIALGEGQLISLGTGGDDSPVKIAKIAISADAIYVLDESKNPIRRYDRAGTAVYTVGAASDPPVRFRSAQAIFARNDSLWVMSMNSDDGVFLLGSDGSVISRLELPKSASLGGISLSRSGLVLSSMFSRDQIRNGTARAVTSLAADGSVLGRGCDSDPIYTSSAKNGGFFALFGSTSVAVLDSLIYCRQAVSPIVHMLRLDATPFAAIRIAPPFYRRGADAPQSLNQLDGNRFTSSFTEHFGFYPFPEGFLSVYTQFNLVENEREYPLFLCYRWQSSDRACSVASTTERPVAFLPPDTLVTVAVGVTSVPALRLVPLR